MCSSGDTETAAEQMPAPTHAAQAQSVDVHDRAGPQVARLTWDEEAEYWAGFADDAGPAGVCRLELGDLTLEFDRLEPGRVTRIFVGFDLDAESENAAVAQAVLGRLPPGQDEHTDSWSVTINRDASRRLWRLADLLTDEESAARAPALVRAVHTVELRGRPGGCSLLAPCCQKQCGRNCSTGIDWPRPPPP